MSQTRQLAAIMFTDIVGYTSMMAKNESRALASLKEVRELLQPLIEQFHGRWVKEIGDGTLSSFNSALDAVKCALAFQQALQAADFKVRIGIHVGDTTFTEKDVFGDGVNIASRIEPLAPPGGIYISGRVNEDIQNHPEISTEFVGDRKLKNISRPIKIYTLVGEGLPNLMESSVGNQVDSFFSDLWQRRFPQTLFIYLGVSLLLVLLTKWFLNTYLLSPYWGDLSWVLLLSLLPSVAVIAYYHGRSGREKWMKAEKVTIPLNLLFTASLLFYSFQGKELGSTTQNITVQDEEGKEIQVVQVKNEFRKRVAFFFFENESNTGADEWLSAGIPVAMEYDLEQDLFFQVRGVYDMVQEIKKNNPTKRTGLPLTLMLKITRDYRYDYFVTGTYNLEDDDYTINTSLYEADPLEKVSSQSATGPDFFELIDQLTTKVKQDLEIPSGKIESTEDLPLASILTSSMVAYKDIISGHEDIIIDNNYQSAIRHFEEAVAKDNQCTFAYLNLAVSYFYNNQFSQAKSSMDKVMEYLYSLPQRDQFAAKSLYYYLEQDQPKRLKVLEMWLELYPEDVDAYSYLGLIYQHSGRLDKAVEVYRKAIEIDDNRGDFYVKLSEVLMAQEKNLEALTYLEGYARQYPDHARSFRLLGDYYLDQGSFDQATQNFERANLLDPDDIDARGKLVMVQERQGEFEQVMKEYQSLIGRCKNTQDSMRVVNLLKNYHFNRGEIREGLLWRDLFLQMYETVGAPVNVSVQKITQLEWYYQIGESDKALQIIKEEEAKLNESLNDLIAFGYVPYYLYNEDLPQAEVAMQRLRKYVQNFGSPGGVELFYEAELHSMKEEYEKAIDKYQAFEATNLFVPEELVENSIAWCLWKMNQPDEALAALEGLLQRYPYQPETHFLVAQIYEDQGKTVQALEHLEITNQVWAQADDTYQKAAEAKRQYRQLKGSL